jgi:hypothetical protein
MSVLGGVRPQMTKCQHCYKPITKLATGNWVDADGFFYCMRTAGPLESVERHALKHAPMPVIR